MSKLVEGLRALLLYGSSVYLMSAVVMFLRISLQRADIRILSNSMVFHGTYAVSGLLLGYMAYRVVRRLRYAFVYLAAVALCVFLLFRLTQALYS